MRKMDKGGKLLSIYWYVVLAITAGAIAYMVYLSYGAPLNVIGVEENALTNHLANCVAEGGYLKENILSGDFKNNFTQVCSLNLSVEDQYGWQEQTQYYAEVDIHKFDLAFPDDAGEKILEASAGNINLKTIGTFEKKGIFSSIFPGRKIDTIVIHATEGNSVQGALDWMVSQGTSVQYMIDRKGFVYSSENTNSKALVAENAIAGHAGCENERPRCHSDSEKPNPLQYSEDSNCCRGGFNSHSIGIEIVNLGILCDKFVSCKTNGGVEVNGVDWENYTDSQIESLSDLVAQMAIRYKIPVDREHIIGHYEIDPGRKTDPGLVFPWDDFMAKVRQKVEQSPISGRAFILLIKIAINISLNF